MKFSSNFSKKAMATGMLVAIIISIVAFVLIVRLMSIYNEKGEEKQVVAICKDSVALRAATALNVAGAEFKTVPTLCKTIDKKISGDKEKIQKQIAESMVTCWQMFGEGRYKSNIFEGISIFATDAKCFTCYTLLIDESRDFKAASPGITSFEFHDFLRKEKLSKIKQLYLDYFQFGGGPGTVIGFLSSEGIKPGRAYAVAYKAKAEAKGAMFLDEFVDYAFSDKPSASIDSIMLVDISRNSPQDQELSNAFFKHCSLVTDIAGGGGN